MSDVEEKKADHGKSLTKSKSKWALEMGGKSLFALIPALAASYFSFSEARLQSNVEIARINAKAGAGYEALVDAVKSLETERVAHAEESKRLAAYVSRLEVRIDGMLMRTGRNAGSSSGRTSNTVRINGAHPSAATPDPATLAPAAPAPGAPAPAVLMSPDKLFKASQKPMKALPKTLDDAFNAAK